METQKQQIQITDIQSDDAGYRDVKKDFKRFYATIYGYNQSGRRCWCM